MIWVAIEDTDTHEVSEFEKVTEKRALSLMREYRVEMNSSMKFQLQGVESGRNVIYDGVVYKGGFGYNIWIGRKYIEL